MFNSEEGGESTKTGESDFDSDIELLLDDDESPEGPGWEASPMRIPLIALFGRKTGDGSTTALEAMCTRSPSTTTALLPCFVPPELAGVALRSIIAAFADAPPGGDDEL